MFAGSIRLYSLVLGSLGSSDFHLEGSSDWLLELLEELHRIQIQGMIYRHHKARWCCPQIKELGCTRFLDREHARNLDQSKAHWNQCNQWQWPLRLPIRFRGSQQMMVCCKSCHFRSCNESVPQYQSNFLVSRQDQLLRTDLSPKYYYFGHWQVQTWLSFEHFQHKADLEE